MTEYEPLTRYLETRSGDRVALNFVDVESLVGRLPPSARTHRTWWANDSKVQAQAWRAAGWRVDSVQLQAERVVFSPGTVGGSRAARIALGTHVVEPRTVQPTPRDGGLCPTCHLAMPVDGVCEGCS